MFFIIAPLNGALVFVYFLFFHAADLLVLGLLIFMGVLEWGQRNHQFVDDERKIV